MEAATRECEQARAIREAALPPEHPQIAETLLNLGVIAIEQGDFERAHELYERGVPLMLAIYGPEHENYAIAVGNRGTVACKRGHIEAGLADLREALELRGQRFPPHAWNHVSSRLSLAECLEEAGDIDGAIAQLEAAVEDTTGAPESAIRSAAIARWNLAQMLDRHRREPARALALAQEARASFERVDTVPDDVAAWLAEHEHGN
jgi:tetratricopeptide (TPR) repeat protein